MAHERAHEELESAGQVVVQDAPLPAPASLRVDFGAHLEAHYQRLVAQLYAITLNPAGIADVPASRPASRSTRSTFGAR